MMTSWRAFFAVARSASVRSLFVLPLVLLMACASSGGGSSSNGSSSSGAGGDGDCGQANAPYFTAQPTVTPSTSSVGSAVFDVTAFFTAPEGTDTIVAYVVDTTTKASYAGVGTLSLVSGDQWNGTTTDTTMGVAGEQFVWIVITDLQNVITSYSYDASQSTTKYYCFQYVNGQGGENPQYGVGLSGFDVLKVTLN